MPNGASAQTVPRRGPPPIASPISDRFYLRGIYHRGDVETVVRLDPTATQAGTVVSAEEDLGLDDVVDHGRMELGIRIKERNRLRIDYFKLNRNGDARLTRQIVFGDDVYNVNDRVESVADLRMLGFTYTRSWLRRERIESGLGLGIHIVDTEGRGTVRARNIREFGRAVAALPTLAADLSWRFWRNFSLTARGQYFGVEIDDVDGSFGDYHLDVQYRWRPNLAVGLGYSIVDVSVVSADVDDPGRFKLRTQGPQAFFRVSF
ncbi:MAG: hypothetical protein RML32_03110 [Gammaproteobacteria bacterium]|nr:hypothetical protein [Gammaproteobacteria bacterium]